MNPNILISACLMGENVRYDGRNNLIDHPKLKQLQLNNQLVLACPESLGGLATPREPAEIISFSKTSSFSESVIIKTNTGIDVSQSFIDGANKTLQLCLKHNIKVALMAAKSPSCGNEETYNGKFEKVLIKQAGISAKLLQQNDIVVFNQHQLNDFFNHIEQLN